MGEALISSDSNLKPPIMPLQIKDLAEEAIILILGYLRAVDLVIVSEVSKSIFKKYHISRAVAFQLDNIYTALSSPIKEKRILDITPSNQAGILLVEYGSDLLFIFEVKAILAALGSPAPISGKGFWISTTWVANAKKYYEALNLPEIRKSGKKNFPRKTSKIRQRRGSDALPPWPSVNADITCPHGELALTKGLRAKKRLLDNRSWTFLRKFFPHGPQYKSTCVMDCSRCLMEDDGAKMSASVKREAGLKSRRSEHLDGPLESLSVRRSGVPSHLLAQKMNSVNESDYEDYALSAAISSSLDIYGQSESHSYCEPCFHSTSRPLLPGLYNLLSRSWLKLWRSYNKNPSVSSLPSMDCTKMLCHSHGLLVIPPHVGDYLIGLKKSLLGGLGQYPGEIVEILSAEEWDAMQGSLKSLSDFSVRFCLHGDDVTWNIGVCTSCCPYSYGPNR